MKIIFSRKGFDKKNGGSASPIFPDGGLCSLPIPAPWDQKNPPAPRYRVRYKDLSYDSESLGSIVEDLSFMPRKGKSRLKGADFCHLDPDLIRGDLVRRAGWLPMFGQGNAAVTHLLRHGVREGDLFLFFGWFNHVQEVEGHCGFDPSKPGAHLIFGWLQIGEVWCYFKWDEVLPKWARYHPHVRGEVDVYHDLSKPVDAVFVAKRHLHFPGIKRRLPGAGVFPTYHTDLRLSHRDNGRSLWKLPGWMYPFPNRMPLTYHRDKSVWRKSGKWAFLQTVGRGQEFILDLDSPEHPEKYPCDKAYRWLAQIFRHAP